MNYKYVMHEGAINDLAEAYIWYETQREGLGEEFYPLFGKYLCLYL